MADLLLDLTYHSVNLLESSLNLQAMSYVGVWVACISICMTNGAISMSMSNKNVLASRFYVGLSMAIQTFSFGSLLTALLQWNLVHDQESSPRVRQIWWGLVDSQGHVLSCLWLYFALRAFIFVHTSWISWSLIPRVDRAEKSVRLEKGIAFGHLAATATSLYIQCVPLTLGDILSMRMTLRRLVRRPLWHTRLGVNDVLNSDPDESATEPADRKTGLQITMKARTCQYVRRTVEVWRELELFEEID